MNPIFPESPQDWTVAKTNKIFYNSKSESYTSIILTDVQVIPEADLLNKSREYYSNFVKNVLSNLNKQEVDIESLVELVKLESNFIDPSPIIREKLLLSIPASALSGIEEKPPKDISSYETNIYDLSTFFTKISNIAAKFEDYQKELVSNIFNKNGNAFYNVDFLAESSALYDLSTNISSLIKSNNLALEKYSKIEISYTSESKIECIRLVEDIDIKQVKYLFTDFSVEFPQNRPQTIKFLYNLSRLSEDIQSGFVTYETIIREYMGEEVNQRQNYTNLKSRSNNKGISNSVSNRDVDQKYASLKNISKKSVKILQQEILNSVYSTPCMTPEERKKINERLERESVKKANFASEFGFSVSDAFFRSLPEVLQKVAEKQGDDAKEALNDLGTNVLNRLGVCGVGDIASLITNTVFAYMDEQEYADELSKCAVKNLNNNKLEKLWEGVQTFGKNTEILEKYRKIVGDTIPPWTTGGYLPPDYQKQLRTDEPVDEKYTLKIPTAVEDTDIDLRFRAFKDSVAGTIRGEDLLNVLVNSFPDEMGWLSFFTDMTKGILNKCRVPLPGANLSFEANWCQKRISLPKLQDLQRSNASFAFKPSTIGTVLVEEIKNTIINLTVSATIAAMKQIFEIISAGASFDSDYFKQNQFIPDLFQPEDAIQYDISSYCGDTSRDYRKTNEAVRDIFYETYRQTSTTNELSLEHIDSFLKSCSVSLSRYDKIRLYNGEAGPTTYDKVISITEGQPIGAYLSNYSDVEKAFLSIGSLLNIKDVEQAFYSSVRTPTPVSVAYCGELPDSLSEGYLRNKPEITLEQIEKMKNTLKDIQRDKICFAVETVGNPRGAIIGQLGEMLESKTGPIFGRIAEEIGELFKPTIENKIKTVSKNYKNDLYNAQGLFDLILVNAKGNGEVRRSFASFFGTPTERPPIGSMQYSRLTATSYSPFKNSTNVSIDFQAGTSIDYLDQQRKLELPKDKEIDASNKVESGSFETGANKIQELLLKNQSSLRDGLNNKISDNFIRNGVLEDLVESYFADMQLKLEKRTYGPSWYKIYDSIQAEESFISDILGEESIINDTKDLYGAMDNFDENYKYAPFNALKSKEEASLSYATFLLLVHTITSEMLLKSLPIYEAFGAEMYHEFDLLGGYIYDKFIETIEEFTTDRGYIKTLEKLVQITTIASNQEIIPPLPSSISTNIDNLNQNIKNWIRGDRGNKVENLEKNQKDIEAVAKFFVKSTALKYIREFQKVMREVERNKFPAINKTNTIYKYIFNQSVLGSVQNVVSDTENVGTLPLGLRLEKYIYLKDAKSGLPSGVQNLSDFQEYLKMNPSVTGNISDNWSSWSFGLRISSVYEFSKAGISESEISLDLRNQNKAFTLISDISESEPEKYFLSPLVVYEKEIPDQSISSKIIDDYDEDSMKKGLSEIPDFLNFYYRGMNIENLMSLTTIYCNEEFSSFLTFEKTDAGILPRTTVENWISGGEKILYDTKRFIVNTLERI